MAGYVLFKQPYYHLHSNFLICVEMTLYGSIHLCLEIGFIIDQNFNTILGTIISGLMRRIERSHWAITQTSSGELVPLFDLSSQDGKDEAWMHIQHHGFDRSIRWYYIKDDRTPILGEYVDILYQEYTIRDPHNKSIFVLYGVFLQYIRKNRIKAHNLLNSARQRYPGIMYRSILFNLMRGQSAASGSGGTEANEIAQKGQLMQAENAKEDARDAQMSFFENLSRSQPNFVLLQRQLTDIVKSEAKAKKLYDSLLSSDPNNIAVLRSYGDLLGVILGDYEMADYVYLKADSLEDDTVDADPTALTGDRKRRKKKKKTADNGMDKMLTSMADTKTSGIFIIIGNWSNCIFHIFGISGFVACAIFVSTFTKEVSVSLRGVNNVGELIMSGVKTSVMFLELLVHEELLWQNMTHTDDSINPVAAIQSHMLRYANRMADIVVEQMNTNVEKAGWEELRIESISVQYDDVLKKPISTTSEPISFLSLTTEIINFAKNLALSSNVSDSVERSHGRIVAHLFNSLQPFVEGGKRLLEDYDRQALTTASRMRTYMNFLCGIPTAVVMCNIAFLYIFLTVSHIKERKALLRDVIEIPKTTIQQYSRDLIEKEETDMAGDMKEEEASEGDDVEVEPDHFVQRRKSLYRKPSRKQSMQSIHQISPANSTHMITPELTKNYEDESVMELKDGNDLKWMNEGSAKIVDSNTHVSLKQINKSPLLFRPYHPKREFIKKTHSARSLLTTRSDDDEIREVTKRDDDVWEDKFEKDVELLQAMYKSMGQVVPMSTRTLMISHITVVFAICCGILLSLYFSSRPYSDFIDNVYVGSIRSVVLAICQTLLYRVNGGSANIEIDPPVVCAASTNPVWKNSSHLSSNISVIRTLFVESIEYWRRLNELTHFGSHTARRTGDRIVDDHPSDRLEPSLNEEMLLDERECFLLAGCTNKMSDRLHQVNSTSATLQALTVRVIQYSWFMSLDSVITPSDEFDIFRYLATAIREDLGGGQRQIVEQMCVASEMERLKFVNQATIEAAVFSIIYLIVMFFTFPVFNRLKRIRNEGTRMVELTTRGETTEEYVKFVEGMVSECEWMDEGRMQIVEKANSVVLAFKHQESTAMTESLMSELELLTKRHFRAEEDFMQKNGMKLSKINTHSLSHRIILQRLRYVFDSFRMDNLARQTIAKRALSRLIASFFPDRLGFSRQSPQQIPHSHFSFSEDHEGIHITIYSGTTLPNPLTRRPLLPSPLDVPCSPLPSTSPAPIFPRCPLLTCGLCRLSESLVIVAEENGVSASKTSSFLSQISTFLVGYILFRDQ
ncbi:hypothetical protein BLNAU_1545 [Blattamonas nauphoetae]|uniref:TmcB/TmcC TPR repeats domain-containing protein n=1 Tax=Blattamonas nauphoetae TaxID=2049346 RepID=A0ABQ9YIB5_9EUKA|nr:hypothetical protein BLNAU_1545 [Blattamonas nauphoetae]